MGLLFRDFVFWFPSVPSHKVAEHEMKIESNGGRVDRKWSSRVQVVVSSTTRFPDFSKLAASSIPILHPLWIDACIQQDVLIPYAMYQIVQPAEVGFSIAHKRRGIDTYCVHVPEHEDTMFKSRVDRLSSGLGLETQKKSDGRGLDVYVISHATMGNVETMIEMGEIVKLNKGRAIVVRTNWLKDSRAKGKVVSPEQYAIHFPAHALGLAAKNGMFSEMTMCVDPSMSKQHLSTHNILLHGGKCITFHPAGDPLDSLCLADVLLTDSRCGDFIRIASNAVPAARIVHPCWIGECIRRETVVSTRSRLVFLPPGNPLQEFQDMRICLTGFVGIERKDAIEMIHRLGAHYDSNLARTTDLLIAMAPCGEKFGWAKENMIQVVNALWLDWSYVSWSKHNVDEFIEVASGVPRILPTILTAQPSLAQMSTDRLRLDDSGKISANSGDDGVDDRGSENGSGSVIGDEERDNTSIQAKGRNQRRGRKESSTATGDRSDGDGDGDGDRDGDRDGDDEGDCPKKSRKRRKVVASPSIVDGSGFCLLLSGNKRDQEEWAGFLKSNGLNCEGPGHSYTKTCTHIVMGPVTRTEKFFRGCVEGKTFVKWEYLDECKKMMKKGKCLHPDEFAYTTKEPPAACDESGKGVDQTVVAKWREYILSTCVPTFHGWVVFVSKDTKALRLIYNVLEDGGAEIASSSEYSRVTHVVHSSEDGKINQRGIPGPIKRRISSLIIIEAKDLLDAIAEGPPPNASTWDQWRPVGGDV